MAEQTHVGMRLAALGFVAVLIQVTVLSQLRVLGGETDLSPLVVAAASAFSRARACATASSWRRTPFCLRRLSR